MSYPFHPRVETTLRQAGWYPGRQVAEDQFAHWQALRPLFPAAEKALREFGDMYLPSSEVHRSGEENSSCELVESVRIDPVSTFDFMEKEHYESYLPWLGPTYPLGLIDCFLLPFHGLWGGYQSMMIDQRGRVFSCFNGFEVLVGNSLEDALQNHLLGQEKLLWNVQEDRPSTLNIWKNPNGA